MAEDARYDSGLYVVTDEQDNPEMDTSSDYPGFCGDEEFLLYPSDVPVGDYRIEVGDDGE